MLPATGAALIAPTKLAADCYENRRDLGFCQFGSAFAEEAKRAALPHPKCDQETVRRRDQRPSRPRPAVQRLAL
jgi:hypothetical protein